MYPMRLDSSCAKAVESQVVEAMSRYGLNLAGISANNQFPHAHFCLRAVDFKQVNSCRQVLPSKGDCFFINAVNPADFRALEIENNQLSFAIGQTFRQQASFSLIPVVLSADLKYRMYYTIRRTLNTNFRIMNISLHLSRFNIQ